MDFQDIFHSSPSATGIPPCEIYVDAEGDWYFKGNQITREDILELFYENLHLTSDHKYLIEWRNQRCLLDVADTPFVIAAADRPKADAAQDDAILLRLRHVAGSERLDPASLWVGADNVLYCHIRQGQWVARFSRPAYYQLAQWIEEDPQSGQFYLTVGGMKYAVGSSEP